MIGFFIVAAIAISIVLGYKTKINTGFYCFAFAYIIGCFIMDISTKELLSYWPLSTMFVILAVSLFYNFATINGTLEKLSLYILYLCRGVPGMLPYALFLVTFILSILGASYFTMIAFMAPITMLICQEARMDKLTGAVAINCGALAGGNFPTASLGVIFCGWMDTAYSNEPDLTPLSTFSTELTIFLVSIVFSILMVSIFRFGFKENRNIGAGAAFEKPKAFDSKQKITLILMALMMLSVLIFPVLHLGLPENAWIADMNGRIDVGMVAMVFTVIAFLLKLAPQKEVITRVPWETILLVSGAGTLVAVAIKAGVINAISIWIGAHVPFAFIPVAFSLIAAFISFFSSMTGVVAPALFPLIPALAVNMGINPIVLFACVILGGQSCAISPISSGGSLILGTCEDEEERNHLFGRLLFVVIPISIISCTIYNVMLTFVM